MKLLYIFPLLFFCFACSEEKSEAPTPHSLEKEQEKQLVLPEFQNILDSAHVQGSILIYDLTKAVYYSNNFDWAQKGHLPASTYKIPNSLIALETGVVENDSTLFEWNGEKRRLKSWEQDLLFKEAFHFSCVPCYQEVARKIGHKRMNNYLNKFDYGNMDVDSTNIDFFWLQGESKIDQFEQIDFLRKLYRSELPISKRTETIAKRMMTIEKNDRYVLLGKTGWSITDGKDNGWFVGYIVKGSDTFIFATNIEPTEHFNMDLFPMIRKAVTLNAFEKLGTMNE